jgi:hypothetical protein
LPETDPEHHDELEMRDENNINGQDDAATAEKYMVAGCGNRGRKTRGGGSGRKTKPTKLTKAIRVPGANTMQSARATILNRT